jgi:hypothetical protein
MRARNQAIRITLICAALAITVLASAPAHAAGPPLSDDALVKLCLDEILSRQPEGETPGPPHIARKQITRSEKQDEVALDLALAEGRPLSARCIVRDGKIFDYHQ